MNSHQIKDMRLLYEAVYDDELRQKSIEFNTIKDFEYWVNSLIEEGYDLSEYALDDIYQEYLHIKEASPSNPNLYKGKHGQTPAQYQAGRSDAGKRISGDDKEGPASYSSRWHHNSPTTPPGARPKNVQKLSASEKKYFSYQAGENKRLRPLTRVGGSKGLPVPVGGSSSLPGVGTPSGFKRYTPGSGGRFGISGIGLADHYDYILEYLLSEGYAETHDDALLIMVNLSEEQINDILIERRREERDEPRPERDRAFEFVKKQIRTMEGKPPGQRKRKKGSPISQPETPVQKFKRAREVAKNQPDPYRPRPGESD